MAGRGGGGGFRGGRRRHRSAAAIAAALRSAAATNRGGGAASAASANRGGGGELNGGYRGGEHELVGGRPRPLLQLSRHSRTATNYNPAASDQLQDQSAWAKHANGMNRPNFNPARQHGVYPRNASGTATRPVPGPHPGPRQLSDWYHGNWHDNWNHPWYRYPAAWWSAGFVAGAALTNVTPWSWGYWPYYNPYSRPR